MYYVYLIESELDGTRRYIGLTSDLRRRLQDHNEGKSLHTAKYKPWHLVTYLAFSDQSASCADDAPPNFCTADAVPFDRLD